MLALLLLLAGHSLVGQSAPNSSGWSNLSTVPIGSHVRMDLVQPESKLKGTLSSVDEAGITLDLGDGRMQTIGKTRVRKLQARGKIRKHAPVIGAAAGAVVLGALASRPGFDFVPSFVALCAAAGGLAGFGIGMSVRYSTMYEMP